MSSYSPASWSPLVTSLVAGGPIDPRFAMAWLTMESGGTPAEELGPLVDGISSAGGTPLVVEAVAEQLRGQVRADTGWMPAIIVLDACGDEVTARFRVE